MSYLGLTPWQRIEICAVAVAAMDGKIWSDMAPRSKEVYKKSLEKLVLHQDSDLKNLKPEAVLAVRSMVGIMEY